MSRYPMPNNEKSDLIADIKRLMSSNIAPRDRYSYKKPNDYKTAYFVTSIFLLMGCFGILAWLAGRGSRNNKCRCD